MLITRKFIIKISTLIKELDFIDNTDSTQNETKNDEDKKEAESKDQNESNTDIEDNTTDKIKPQEEFDVSEFRIDEQLSDDKQEAFSENISQKLSLKTDNKDYTIYTTKFDEISKAETLESLEEIKNLEQI